MMIFIGPMLTVGESQLVGQPFPSREERMRQVIGELVDIVDDQTWQYDASDGNTYCIGCGAFNGKMQPLYHKADCSVVDLINRAKELLR